MALDTSRYCPPSELYKTKIENDKDISSISSSEKTTNEQDHRGKNNCFRMHRSELRIQILNSIFRISEKMKIFKKMIVLASATLAQDVADSNTNSTKSIGGMGLERQYTDLLKLVKHYSPEFDVRKYWAYGCNCLIMGDLPMSGPGYGQPVDALDMICKQYKVKYNDICNNIII